MALNEIVSGMPLAAEKINENFQEIGLIETGKEPSNMHNQYMKFPDGTIMIWGLSVGAKTIQPGQSVEVVYDYPITLPSNNNYPQLTVFSSQEGVTATVTAKTDKQLTFKMRNNGSSVAYAQAFVQVSCSPTN